MLNTKFCYLLLCVSCVVAVISLVVLSDELVGIENLDRWVTLLVRAHYSQLNDDRWPLDEIWIAKASTCLTLCAPPTCSFLKAELITKLSETNQVKNQTVLPCSSLIMAPTAAMLILPHVGETAPPPLEVKVSASKWMALGKSFLLRTKSGSKSKQPNMEVHHSSSSDSALESRLLEALEHTWW
ncbi:hypothetical protein F3Y22_tig00110391pilonHSYRG00096 [Hibiscus syriacus]|uniref:Uncharacterized protein n=1 Tax=Hibiscus syriacus TaxID=106335 RepID=A0A6A3AU34_HIBSY|nr:hypothetical protein F3Y22_tig00110391pilonHSYRG00096 [Hibiscus syriacus]